MMVTVVDGDFTTTDAGNAGIVTSTMRIAARRGPLMRAAMAPFGRT
jgi:hypothetical protein